MLDNIRHLTGTAVNGPGGRVGVVKEVLFDTRTWVIRHLSVGLEDDVSGSGHLVSPRFIQQMLSPSQAVEISLTDMQVAACPLMSSPRMAHGIRGRHTPNDGDLRDGCLDATQEEPAPPGPVSDAYVRNSLELTGCVVLARDGAAGEVDDLFFENETWRIEFLLVDTAGWLDGGRKVLLAPKRVERLDLPHGLIHMELTREQIMQAPEYHEMVVDETRA